jgi:hypothetical protein
VGDGGIETPEGVPQARPGETVGRGQARLGQVPPTQEGKGVWSQDVGDRMATCRARRYCGVLEGGNLPRGGVQRGELGGKGQVLRPCLCSSALKPPSTLDPKVPDELSCSLDPIIPSCPLSFWPPSFRPHAPSLYLPSLWRLASWPPSLPPCLCDLALLPCPTAPSRSSPSSDLTPKTCRSYIYGSERSRMERGRRRHSTGDLLPAIVGAASGTHAFDFPVKPTTPSFVHSCT